MRAASPPKPPSLGISAAAAPGYRAAQSIMHQEETGVRCVWRADFDLVRFMTRIHPNNAGNPRPRYSGESPSS